MTLLAVDKGSPTTSMISLFGPLMLGANGYNYEFSGSPDLTDAGTDDVSMTAVSMRGSTGFVFGVVNGAGVAAVGGGLTGAEPMYLRRPRVPERASLGLVAAALELMGIARRRR